METRPNFCARFEKARTYRRRVPLLTKLHLLTKAVGDFAVPFEGSQA